MKNFFKKTLNVIKAILLFPIYLIVAVLLAPFALVILLVLKFSYSKEEKKKFTQELKARYKEAKYKELKAKKDKATKEPITSDKKDELNNQH